MMSKKSFRPCFDLGNHAGNEGKDITYYIADDLKFFPKPLLQGYCSYSLIFKFKRASTRAL